MERTVGSAYSPPGEQRKRSETVPDTLISSLPRKPVGHRHPARQPASQDKQPHGCGQHERGAHVGMEEPMPRILIREHVVQGLDIYEDIRRTKRQKAKLPWCHGVQGSPWAEVKGGERHGFLLEV